MITSSREVKKGPKRLDLGTSKRTRLVETQIRFRDAIHEHIRTIVEQNRSTSKVCGMRGKKMKNNQIKGLS